MGEAKRRKQVGNRKPAVQSFHEAMSRFADAVLDGPADAPTIAIGPVLWDIEKGHDRKIWYFMVASTDPGGLFRVTQLKLANDDQALIEQSQAALMMELIQRRPVVMHSFDDELAMMRFCETAWPCDRTRGLRESIERERPR